MIFRSQLNIDPESNFASSVGQFAIIKGVKKGTGNSGGNKDVEDDKPKTSIETLSDLELDTRFKVLPNAVIESIKELQYWGSNSLHLLSNLPQLNSDIIGFIESLFQESLRRNKEIGGLYFDDGTYIEGEPVGESTLVYRKLAKVVEFKLPLLSFHTHPDSEAVPSIADFTFAELNNIPVNVVVGGSIGDNHITVFNKNSVTGVYNLSDGKLIAQNIEFIHPQTYDQESKNWYIPYLSYRLLDFLGDESEVFSENDPTGFQTVFINIPRDGGSPEIQQEGKGGEGQSVRESDEIVLIDSERNIYNLNTVTILTKDFSKSSGEVSFPKPYILDEEFNVLEAGAKVLIIFPFGRGNPVIAGCLNSLNVQDMNWSDVTINRANLYREAKVKSGSNWVYREEIADGNKSEVMENGSLIRSAREISDCSDNIVSSAEENNSLFGRLVEVGGRNERLVDGETDLKNKSDEVSIYSKEINLGHSNNRGEEFELDADNEIDSPKFQNAVMGITLKTLIEILIDVVTNAVYMGNGVVVRMSLQDRNDLINKVKRKLPNSLSSCVRLLYDGEQVE